MSHDLRHTSYSSFQGPALSAVTLSRTFASDTILYHKCLVTKAKPARAESTDPYPPPNFLASFKPYIIESSSKILSTLYMVSIMLSYSVSDAQLISKSGRPLEGSSQTLDQVPQSRHHI